jgi:molybdate transport system permease protein
MSALVAAWSEIAGGPLAAETGWNNSMAPALDPVGALDTRAGHAPVRTPHILDVPGEAHPSSGPSRAPVLAISALAGLLILFLAIPVGALVIRALESRQGWDAATREILWQALSLSLLTTAISMVVVIALGTPLAYLLARRRFPGVTLVEALIDLPIVLPPAVAGIALLMAFGRRGVVGQWLDQGGLTLGFTTAAVVMAQIFVAAPYFVIAARSGFSRIDRDVEEAAADLGASPVSVFRTVTLPLIAPSLIAGTVLAWARALGEFGATIMFAGSFPGVTQTMPLAIYGRFGAGDLTSALLLSVVLLLASLVVLFGVRLLGARVRGGI